MLPPNGAPTDPTDPTDDPPDSPPSTFTGDKTFLQRSELLLNGNWAVGGKVPVYEGILNTPTKTFEQDVTVPAGWKGQTLRIEFNSVAYIAQVYVDQQLVGEHVGAWMPFAIDITSRVTAGQSFRLKVVVKDAHNSPIQDAQGNLQWPVGGWESRMGINDDVWLRAYGKVRIENTYLQTSFRNKTLSIQYQIKNSDSVAHAIVVQPLFFKTDTAKSFVDAAGESKVTLAAGETKTVVATYPSDRFQLYWPDQPTLYWASTKITEDGKTLDADAERFGFREIWTSGNQFYWNGVRINLYGDYQVYGDTYYGTYVNHAPDKWPAAIDRMKALNIRVMRWHHNPVPQYILDRSDEKGFLVVSESPLYAREYYRNSVKSELLKHTKESIAGWIPSQRNHPSIYLWSAENENIIPYKLFGDAEMKSLGDEIRKYDTSRPVGYDGDEDVGDTLTNRHYPEGYNHEPSGSIYSWNTTAGAGRQRVSTDQPTGSGELLHAMSPDAQYASAVERNKWWIGIWLRGLRYTNWTDVRPACFFFADADTQSSNAAVRQRAINLKNAYAPVAVFDKAYDDLGIAPYVNGTTAGGTLPSINAGTKRSGTLVVYNDEFRGTKVTVEVSIEVNGSVRAQASQDFDITLGRHVTIPYTVTVPNVAGQELSINLKSSKAGVSKFTEARKFKVNAGSDATAAVTLGAATLVP